MKTFELTGLALDWAVAKCEGENLDYWFEKFTGGADRRALLTKYSSNWAQGGPIIEREKITLAHLEVEEGAIWWEARHFDDAGKFRSLEYGPTPLVASMRCYVASKLGDDVEIPEGLK